MGWIETLRSALLRKAVKLPTMPRLAGATRPGLHRPERAADETQDAYRARRRESALVARAMRQGPRQSPAVSNMDVARFWLGQHEAGMARRDRRRLVKALGIRQAKRATHKARSA